MGKKILIVDDEKDPRSALATAFRNEGFEVFEAGDGEEGLQLVLKEKPDLILLDIIMPKINGLEVLERIKGDESTKHIKVILLTVLEDMESVSRAIEHGGQDYFVKTNWKLQDIVDKVKEKLA